MLAWRICRERYSDLDGEGSRLFGGRWNTRGRAVVYCASSAALAVLEVRVHLDLPFELIPDDYMLDTLDLGDLPAEIVETPRADATSFGDAWIAGQRTLSLHVPSFIVPESANILLNPAHPAAAAVSVVRRRKLEFDRRLWGVT